MLDIPHGSAGREASVRRSKAREDRIERVV
jgi:hypothetical protein